MTTANKITLFRIVMIPVFLVLAYTGHPHWALAVFIVASLSDMADGYIARHYNQITDFGKFMDPLADKMLVLSAMCYFIENGQMPGWVVAVVLFREFAVSGLRLVAVEQSRVIAAAWSGKIKTTVTMICLAAMLLFPGVRALDLVCCALILITTVYSGVEYFMKNIDVFKGAK
ncbi:MAG: CDP-diacylglycerol--glycerol-3-phosphate 3-phosphatidyltransferase [Oscillospiraceae bacterium]|nr:CDP-diacylglycerol--glycerol-3-phosphate 3-phosphatidyltransferase [Oscillospiraceae bacterium]